MYSREAVTDALVAMLASVTGKEIGDAKAPAPTGTNPLPDLPYAVVYPMPYRHRVNPDFADADPDVALIYQVTSVGENRGQAEWMADQVYKAILTRSGSGFANAITLPPGHKVYGRSWEESGPASYEGELVGSHESFALYVSPA